MPEAFDQRFVKGHSFWFYSCVSSEGAGCGAVIGVFKDDAGDSWCSTLTRAVPVAGRRPAVAGAGQEVGQAGEVCVLTREEGLGFFS